MSTPLTPGSVAVILPAAGKSRRFGGPQPKIFAPLAGQAVWWHAANRLRQLAEVGQIVIVINPDDRGRWKSEFADSIASLKIELVEGGSQRYDSVWCGIDHVKQAEFVAVHDAARPLVSEADLRRLFQAAASHDAVMLASPVRGTIKRSDNHGVIQSTVDRDGLWEAQTPQMFRRKLLVEAYQRWRGWPVTDDASLVERCGGKVQIVQGSPLNVKITSQEDLQLAEAILQSTADLK